MEKSNFYIGANGVLKMSRFKFHYPITGFVENDKRINYGNPIWIKTEDINPLSPAEWTDHYNAFRGAKLYNRKK